MTPPEQSPAERTVDVVVVGAEPTGEGCFSGGATPGAAIAFGQPAGAGAVARTAGLARHATR